jgi:hypothetical protein
VKLVSALLAMFLVACGPTFETPVSILTGDLALTCGGNGCAPGPFNYGPRGIVAGQLVADPKFGTVIMDVEHRMVNFGQPVCTVVAWPSGFTAGRHENQIRVFDPQGNVVAVTGQAVRLDGGYAAPNPAWPDSTGAFLAQHVSDFVGDQKS